MVKTTYGLIVPKLSSLFCYCLEHQVLPSSLMEAYVILLPKPGKDPSECSSYRPIALLNQDLKILTKVLANRLSQVITILVDIDQTGFMPKRSTDTILRRLFTHLQADHFNSGTSYLILLNLFH